MKLFTLIIKLLGYYLNTQTEIISKLNKSHNEVIALHKQEFFSVLKRKEIIRK